MSTIDAKINNFLNSSYLKYAVFVFFSTFFIMIFSAIMYSVAVERKAITETNYDNIEEVYSGELSQKAPVLNKLREDSYYYDSKNLTQQRVQYYLDNTNLISTSGNVIITADFVKKGLVFQPTYKTRFNSSYVLQNKLNEESVIAFDFPFPGDVGNQEISNAILKVEGEVYKDSKAQVVVSGVTTEGLKWEGAIPAGEEIEISISYDTVGLSSFVYEGFENTKGSQNFDFQVKIDGTRAYDVVSGLSVDERKFENNSTTLIWKKESLYSRPVINISVGEKIEPSVQVGRVYQAMTPLYLAFVVSLIFLAVKFGKNLKSIDLGILAVLFVIFFPLFHYLSSFTIDPTSEIFAGMNVGQFSLGLYKAFGIAFGVIALLMAYLLARTQGKGFSLKFGLPLIFLALGYFPLVATIPEYFGLLSLIGMVLITVVVMQIRLKRS